MLGSAGVVLDHDIVLTPSDGSGALGLMLARPDNVRKAWQLSEIPTPTGVRVTSQGLSLADSPPEMAAVVYRSEHTGGMGSRIINPIGTDYMSGDVHTSVGGKTIKPPAVDEITLPTSEGDVRCWEEWSGALYVSDGRYLHKSSNGTAFSQVLNVGSGNRISSILKYGASTGTAGIVVGIEASATETPGAYYYSTDGSTFTQVTAGSNRDLNYFFLKDGTLYGLANPSTMVTTTDPFSTTATWGSATTIGDKAHNFQGGFVVAGLLVIFKEDRAFTVDSTGAVSTLIAQFADIPSDLNFDQSCVGWNSNIYFSIEGEVWEYDPVSGGIRPLDLAKLPDSVVVSGVKDGLAYGDDGAVYAVHRTNLAATNAGSVVRLTFDRDGTTHAERWALQTLNGYRPQGPLRYTRAFSSVNTGHHLFFATNTAGKIGRLSVPRAVDPTTDSASVYSLTDSTFRSGWMHHNYPAQLKDYTEVLVDLRGVTPVPPTSSVDVYYYLDGDLTTRYTLATDLTANKLHSLLFDNGVTARTFLLELVLRSALQSVTPEVLSWNVKASVKFDLREIFTLSVRVGDNIRNRMGQRSPYTAAQIRSRLRTLRAAKNVTIRYQDYRGYDFTNIRILPGFGEIDEVDQQERDQETIMTFRVMRVASQTLGQFIVGTDVVAGPARVGA